MNFLDRLVGYFIVLFAVFVLTAITDSFFTSVAIVGVIAYTIVRLHNYWQRERLV